MRCSLSFRMRRSAPFLTRFAQTGFAIASGRVADIFCYFNSQVQASVNDLAKFQRIVKMIAFHPFDSAENALENINAVTEHEMTADLRVMIAAAPPLSHCSQY